VQARPQRRVGRFDHFFDAVPASALARLARLTHRQHVEARRVLRAVRVQIRGRTDQASERGEKLDRHGRRVGFGNRLHGRDQIADQPSQRDRPERRRPRRRLIGQLRRGRLGEGAGLADDLHPLARRDPRAF
jgi:hypothetical protein